MKSQEVFMNNRDKAMHFLYIFSTTNVTYKLLEEITS